MVLLILVVGGWLSALLLVLGLCAAAKDGDAVRFDAPPDGAGAPAPTAAVTRTGRRRAARSAVGCQ